MKIIAASYRQRLDQEYTHPYPRIAGEELPVLEL